MSNKEINWPIRIPHDLRSRLESFSWEECHKLLNEYLGLREKVISLQNTLVHLVESHKAEESRDIQVYNRKVREIETKESERSDEHKKLLSDLDGKKIQLEARLRDLASLDERAKKLDEKDRQLSVKELELNRTSGYLGSKEADLNSKISSYDSLLVKLSEKEKRLKEREEKQEGLERFLQKSVQDINKSVLESKALLAQAEEARKEIEHYVSLKQEVEKLKSEVEEREKAVSQDESDVGVQMEELNRVRQKLEKEMDSLDEREAQIIAREREIQHEKLVQSIPETETPESETQSDDPPRFRKRGRPRKVS